VLRVKSSIAPTVNTEWKKGRILCLNIRQKRKSPAPTGNWTQTIPSVTTYFSSSYSDIISNKIIYSYFEQNIQYYFTEKKKGLYEQRSTQFFFTPISVSLSPGFAKRMSCFNIHLWPSGPLYLNVFARMACILYIYIRFLLSGRVCGFSMTELQRTRKTNRSIYMSITYQGLKLVLYTKCLKLKFKQLINYQWVGKQC
jgi:hypothetical protein